MPAWENREPIIIPNSTPIPDSQWLALATEDIGPRYDVPVWRVILCTAARIDGDAMGGAKTLTSGLTYTEAAKYAEEWYASHSS